MFKPGDLVINASYPKWGTGKVLECYGGTVTVLFENEGKKRLNMAIAKLEKASSKRFDGSRIEKNDFKKTIVMNESVRYLDDYTVDNPYICLTSNKASRLDRPIKCDECGVVYDGVYVFAKSDCGKVYICSRCKPILMDRAFEKDDAMNHAKSGGGFETNKRRH